MIFEKNFERCDLRKKGVISRVDVGEKDQNDK